MTDGVLVVDDESAYAVVPCLSCGSTFPCHPNLVPSMRVDGVRHAICSSCMVTINTKRRDLHLPPFDIPEGAYAPCPIAEL